MGNNSKHHDDLWYKQVNNRLKTNDKSSKFVGHCYKLKLAIENCAIKKETRSTTNKYEVLLYMVIYIPLNWKYLFKPLLQSQLIYMA